MTVKEALQQLDPTDDAQWTSDGLPLVEVVRGLCGNQELNRKDITDALPDFCRDKALVKNEEPVEKPKNRDEAFRAEQKQLEQEINELQHAQHEIEIKIAEKQDRWTRLQAHFDRQSTGESDTQARLDYIASQNKLRLERAQRRQQVLKGLDPTAVTGKAPIDEAMSRKNTRGTVRPKFTPDSQKQE